jgi:hypothetical protein
MLLAALLAACGADDTAAGGDFILPSRSTTEAGSLTEEAPGESETESTSWSYPWDAGSETQTQTQGAAQTQPSAQTAAPTRAPGTSSTGKASTVTTTKKPTATVTTTKSGTTKHYDNPITIQSAEAALLAFNNATKTAVNGKAGFSKSHVVTYKDWELDPTITPVLTFPIIGDQTKVFTDQLNKALNSGTNTAVAYKGDPQGILKASGFTMADLKSDGVTYSRNGSDWIVTLNVNNGNTRQEKRLLSKPVTGVSPIDNGPLALATGDGGLYDHMRADNIFSLMTNNALLGTFNIEPIDIQESTSQVKFVANLDGEGKLLTLTVTYNQTVNLADIHVMDGTSYKNNVGSASVKVVFKDFVY